MTGGMGLGDTAQSVCGLNPCGFFDYIYASDACLNYKLCAFPNDPTTILESQGLIAGGGTLIGGTAGQAVTNLVQSTFTNPDTGGLNVTTLLVAFGVLYFLVKR